MRLNIASPRLTLFAGFAAVVLASFALLQATPAIDDKLLDEGFALNRLNYPTPVSNDVVVVGINEAFLDGIDEPLTLSHRYLANFLRAASGAGAVVIGMDLSLPEKRFDTLRSTTDEDADFHRMLLRGLMEASSKSKLVLAKVWDYDRGHYRDIQIDYGQVLSLQDESVQAKASALVCRDADQVARRYPNESCQPDHTPFTLSSEMAAAMGVRQPWKGLINFQVGGPITYLPMQDALKYLKEGNQARLEQLFKGKAVLLGSVQDEIDLIDLPVPLAEWLPDKKRVPGVLVHAQAVRSMLNQGFVQQLDARVYMALAMAMTLFWFHRSVVAKLAVLTSLTALTLFASVTLLRHNLWIAPGGILMVAWLAALARTALQAARHFGERQRLKSTFAGYVSPEVMKQIVAGGVDARKQGAKLEVTVLFSDIRNFTTLSEQMPAEAVVALLNRYFGRMTAMVHKHGGTVDKFIGDGMMAFFGAPNPLESPDKSALEAARDMLGELEELNAELAEEGMAPLAIGVGIHTGPAVIGYIGSADRHEFTAIGDTVNVASRLEGLCKSVGYPIVCSGAVAERLGHPAILEALGDQAVKGRADVSVYGWRPDMALGRAA